ncbi:MAG TPA: aromatic ring-hydroxylating dioxygenase subunit alpha [Desulfobacterales bacterium]|nr:aromatic ring-hydroxylating dioxygenase subunit alpha [Desulfobacterales bacterium]
MIPNQWYVVLESCELAPWRLLGVTRMGERLVFARDRAGKAFCLRDRCAHRGAALSAGKHAGDAVACPFHGFRYDASGRGVLIPANGRAAEVPERFRVHAYAVHEAHGYLWIWWSEHPPAHLGPPRFFEDLEGFAWGTAVDPWDAHYSRVIENQLDVVHLPFVHSDTIGRGNRTLVNGPVVEWRDRDRFFVRVFNEVDAGQRPRPAAQIAPPYPSFHLDFIFPNLWQNWIAEKVRVGAAFVPVDSDHTLLYLRFYQKFLPGPLGKLVARLAMRMNLRIARQDRRVVQTQQPKPSGLKIGENLVAGDGPIVAYRRRRQELMDAARG